MAYSEIMALQIRDTLNASGMSGLSEKRMMGGLIFLINGNMLLGLRTVDAGETQFMFRVGKENEAEAFEIVGTRPMIHGGRHMSGFLFINEADEAVFKRLLAMSRRFVESLPPK